METLHGVICIQKCAKGSKKARMDKGCAKIQQCITKYYKSFVLYFCLGGFCALIDWGVFYILYSRIKFTYLLAAFLLS